MDADGLRLRPESPPGCGLLLFRWIMMDDDGSDVKLSLHFKDVLGFVLDSSLGLLAGFKKLFASTSGTCLPQISSCQAHVLWAQHLVIFAFSEFCGVPYVDLSCQVAHEGVLGPAFRRPFLRSRRDKEPSPREPR